MRFLTAAVLVAGLFATPVQADTTLNVWHLFNLKTDMIYEGIAQFEKAHPDIHVQARLVPLAQMGQELIRALATGNVPDIATVDNPVVASFAAQGQLEEIGPDLAKLGLTGDKFYPGPWASVTWEGKVYGAPRASNTIALYYNADMFRKAGLDPDNPPKTWAELESAAEKLTDKAGKVYGLAFCAVQSDEGVFQFLPFLEQAGGSVSKIRLAGGGHRAAVPDRPGQEGLCLAGRGQHAAVRGDQHDDQRQRGHGDFRPVGAAAHRQGGQVRLARRQTAGDERRGR